MKTQPTLLDRIGAFSVLALAAGAVLFVGVLPLKAEIAATEDRIAHNRKLIAGLASHADTPSIPASDVSALRKRIAQEGRYLREPTEPLAAAALQQHIKGLLEEFGASAQSIRNIPRAPDDARRSIALRVVTQGESEQMIEFLYTLETETPFVVIEKLKASSNAWRRRLTGQPPADVMAIEFTAVAFMPPWDAAE